MTRKFWGRSRRGYKNPAAGQKRAGSWPYVTSTSLLDHKNNNGINKRLHHKAPLQKAKIYIALVKIFVVTTKNRNTIGQCHSTHFYI